MMKLIYKSEVIDKPFICLVDSIWKKINEMSLYAYSNYVIKMGGVLYMKLEGQMINHDLPVMVKGIKCYEDNSIEDGIYCIYRKDESIPIELTPVKTLDGWFANLPLIYKLDLYNSRSETITKHLK